MPSCLSRIAMPTPAKPAPRMPTRTWRVSGAMSCVVVDTSVTVIGTPVFPAYTGIPMTAGPPLATPLPRGRHAAPPEVVWESQRGRMLAAMATAVGEKGYAEVAVADVIARAGVSRKTFYEQFDNKLGCFLAAYDAGVEL